MPGKPSNMGKDLGADISRSRRLRGQCRDCQCIGVVVEKPSPDPCAKVRKLPVTEGRVQSTASGQIALVKRQIAHGHCCQRAGAGCWYQGPMAMRIHRGAWDSHHIDRGGH